MKITKSLYFIYLASSRQHGSKCKCNPRIQGLRSLFPPLSKATYKLKGNAPNPLWLAFINSYCWHGQGVVGCLLGVSQSQKPKYQQTASSSRAQSPLVVVALGSFLFCWLLGRNHSQLLEITFGSHSCGTPRTWQLTSSESMREPNRFFFFKGAKAI